MIVVSLIFLHYSDDLAIHRTRWYASYILLFAYVPILLLYSVWLPLTCMGKIKAADIPENDWPSPKNILAGDASVPTPSAAAQDNKDNVEVICP